MPPRRAGRIVARREAQSMPKSLCILLLAMASLTAAPRVEDPAQAEAKRLEGHWKGVELETEGRKLPAEAIESLKEGGWTFKGSEVTFEDANAPGKSSFKLDPGKNPKEIDLTGLDGPQKGKTILGIYKLEGKRLTICVRGVGTEEKGRPTEFVTKAGSGLGLIVLERAEK